MPKFRISSIQHSAGQRLMIGFDGTVLNDQLKFYIKNIGVGGIILFSRNLVSPEQIEALCNAAQNYARACGQPPLLIGIDQEGGQVARLKPPFTQFAGNPAMRTHDEAVAFARTTAHELSRIGVNMNMAPVMDVLPDNGPSIMAKRSFGKDPRRVAEMGKTVIENLQKNGVAAVAKHFPGIGRTVLDSHLDLPDLDLDAQSLYLNDLFPFQFAIDNGVGGIMLSHIRYLAFDAIWPASLSPRIAGDLLRRQMGYGGVVLTDDLDMGAIARFYEIPDIVEQCLLSEVDILLVCHPSPKIEAVFSEMALRLETSQAMTRLGEESLMRIDALKKRYIEGL